MISKTFLFSAILILPISLFCQVSINYNSSVIDTVIIDQKKIDRIDFVDTLSMSFNVIDDPIYNRNYIHYPLDEILLFENEIINYGIYYSDDNNRYILEFQDFKFGSISYELQKNGYYTILIYYQNKSIKAVTYLHKKGYFTKKFKHHFIKNKSKVLHEKK